MTMQLAGGCWRRPIEWSARWIAAVLAISLLAAANETPRAFSQTANPYLAPQGSSPAQLHGYIERMQSKPLTIRRRPGFTEAMLDAAGRLLAADAPQEMKTAAVLAKFRALDAASVRGDGNAAGQLQDMAKRLSADSQPDIRREARYYLLAARVIEVTEAGEDELVEILEQLADYFTAVVPDARHEQIASRTVRLINLLPDDQKAAGYYRTFGKLFAKSQYKKLADYGRRIARGPRRREPRGLSRFVGQQVAISGTTLDGGKFDMTAVRGKFLLVIFWATWSPSSVDELAKVQAHFEQFHPDGLEMVGISLDEDPAALAGFVRRRPVPWPILFSGKEGQTGWDHPLAAQFRVQSIPATMLVGPEGTVVAANLRGEALKRELTERFASQARSAEDAAKNAPAPPSPSDD